MVLVILFISNTDSEIDSMYERLAGTGLDLEEEVEYFNTTRYKSNKH